MIELDKDALEAAAKALYRIMAAHQGEMRDTWNEEPDEAREAHGEFADAAITAYLTAIAPQVREAVQELSKAAKNYGWWDNTPNGPNLAKANAVEDAIATLLTLLGAQEAE